MKALADVLEIRTPSLYNHIDNIDDLRREVAHAGMIDMNTQMVDSPIGKTGEDAIKAIADSYLKYMIRHLGVYDTIQWASWHRDIQPHSLDMHLMSRKECFHGEWPLHRISTVSL